MKVSKVERGKLEQGADRMVFVQSVSWAGPGRRRRCNQVSRAGVIFAGISASRLCGRFARQGGSVDGGIGPSLERYAADRAFEVAWVWIARREHG
eukprot:8038188-Lingulodinium_polyedra.AAC.1